jgi:TonB family protein
MSKPESWKSWEGRLVDGKFPLRQWLGGSDHSAVFLTEMPGSSRQKAAIKFIESENGAGAGRQLNRLRATAKLTHPNLIRTFEAGRCQMNGTPLAYVVMECAEEDLSQILPQRALAPAEVADLLPPVLDALSHLHSGGVVHGRIKPSNVLAVGDQLKLSSDQVATVADQNAQRRRRDAYDAPETAAGIVSPAGDVWSVGVTIVAALTQNVAFAEEGSQSDAGLPQSIPEPFRTIAQQCLRLDPKQRCSLREIQTRLKPGERTAPAEIRQPAAPAQSSTPRRLFPVAMVLAVVIALLLAIFYFRGRKSADQTQEAAQPPASSSVQAPAPPPPPASSGKPKPTDNGRAAGGEVRHEALPDVPQSAKNTITGTIKVVIRVQVDASGKVTSANLKSAGSSRYFAGLALKAAPRWEFTPPEVGGQPAASTWLIQFHFRRLSTQASAQRVPR